MLQRYIRLNESWGKFVKLKVITVFTVIGATFGMIGLFFDTCLIFDKPLCDIIRSIYEKFGIFAIIIFALSGYFIPFLWVGIKQWFSLISSSEEGCLGCLFTLIFLCLPHVFIPIFAIYYAFIGIIAIIKRDFERHDPSDFIKKCGPAEGGGCDDPRWY